MRSALVDEFDKLARKSIRHRLREEKERVGKTGRQALAYGVGGAVANPAFRKLYRVIEHKGKLDKPKAFYRMGKHRIPSWIPASAATGFLGAGILPYIGDILRERRARKKAAKEKKAGPLLSPRIFMPPHARGKMQAMIPELSKSHAKQTLGASQRVARLDPGAYRT
jgi:hypothetical protein